MKPYLNCCQESMDGEVRIAQSAGFPVVGFISSAALSSLQVAVIGGLVVFGLLLLALVPRQ